MPDYKSLADIDNDFQRRIEQAEEGDRPSLREAHANAKVQFLSSQLQARELQAARGEAVRKYSIPEAFAEMISGGSAEEIEASAQKLQAAIQAIAQPAAPQGQQQVPSAQQPPPTPQVPQGPDAATLAYGQPGVGGVGVPAPAPDRQQELFRKMVGQGGGRNRNITRTEAEEYRHERMKQVLGQVLANKGTPIGLGRGVRLDDAMK